MALPWSELVPPFLAREHKANSRREFILANALLVSIESAILAR